MDDPGAFDQEEAWLAQGTAVVTPAPDWQSSLKLGFTQNQGAAKALGTNLGFTQRLWQIYVRGENLTDTKTPESLSFGFPGRAIYGGLRLSLD